MEISINRGKDTLLVCPKAPIYLSDEGKKFYKNMGNILAKNGRLKETYLNALEIYSEAMWQYQFAVSQIKAKNKFEYGTGFIQTFKTGAQNISVELTLKNNAEDTLLKCFKLFGLDPKSEKELKETADPNQGDLFESFLNSTHG
jgi:P27 family predicted phage terminase small subunit